MPQARPRNKNASNKRHQKNQSGERRETGGREGGKNPSKIQQEGGGARGQRGMQGARSQRVNNQQNANYMPAEQRDRDEYDSVRGRNSTETHGSEWNQPRYGRGQEGRGRQDGQRELSDREGSSERGQQSRSRGGQSEQGRGNGGRGQGQSSRRSSGYNYQEEDFEEGGQNEATSGRGAGQNRGQSYQQSGSERGQQYDGDDFHQGGQYGRQQRHGGHYEDQGNYGPRGGRNYQDRAGWGEHGARGQYQNQDEGDWERAGPGNYQGGEFQGGRSNRGRDAGYYGASQYSQGGGRGDYRDEEPNWNQRYGNVNRVPGGIEDEEFAESRQYNDRGGQRGRGQRGNGGGFENARGEYSNFNAGGPAQDEDSEMNDYTDARLGSTAKRGARPTGKRSKQDRITGSGRSAQSTSSTRRQQKSRSTGR